MSGELNKLQAETKIWLAARDVIRTAICGRSFSSFEGAERAAASIISRLAAHDPPLVICAMDQMTDEAFAPDLEEQPPPLLVWRMEDGTYREAWLGREDDGVRFSLERRATCYRRGPWRLLIEVMFGPRHHDWGCFDDADQPERNYHSKECAMQEAEAIAKVLLKDRLEHGPLDELAERKVGS